MKKTVRIGSIKYYGHARLVDIFCKIEIEQGKLSISGVEGPLKHGDCIGSCGQIDMHLREQQADIIPADGWDADKLKRFFEIWEAWHLNDMRPNCQHQIGPEWDTKKEIVLYYFRLTKAANELRKETNKAAAEAIKRGETFTPSLQQCRMAKLSEKLISPTPKLLITPQFSKELAACYEPNAPMWENDHYTRASEKKTAGWVRPDEHPDGLLCKPCPVCGYKYGSQWLREELPADVIAFLEALPETDRQPAWV